MPEGLLYRQHFITGDGEAALITQIGKLPLEATTSTRVACAGAADPAVRAPLCGQVARVTGTSADDFRHALITEYRPGTQPGWHRDVGEFDIVAGVSLAGTCRMRFRRWQHSIAPAPELRYSVTLRTLR
jgi:alkylated DNA repair dioxygenase AlkB